MGSTPVECTTKKPRKPLGLGLRVCRADVRVSGSERSTTGMGPAHDVLANSASPGDQGGRTDVAAHRT